MNARDFENKKFISPIKPREKKQKVSIWDKLSDLSLDTFSDRIKIIVVFTIIGLVTIFAGDLLSLRGTGIAFQLIGWIIISAGFIIPFVKFMDEHS
jgi:hypothetical protein